MELFELFSVPHPYPVKVPIIKTIFHKVKSHGGHGHGGHGGHGWH